MLFHVDDMSCSGCVSSVTRAIRAVDQKADVIVDLEAKTVSVESGADAVQLRTAIENAGFPVRAT